MKCVVCGGENGDLRVLGVQSRQTMLDRAATRVDEAMQQRLGTAYEELHIHNLCRAGYVNKSNVAKAAALAQSQRSTIEKSSQDDVTSIAGSDSACNTTQNPTAPKSCMFCNHNDGDLKVVGLKGLNTIASSSKKRGDGRFANIDITAGPYFIHNVCRGQYTKRTALPNIWQQHSFLIVDLTAY